MMQFVEETRLQTADQATAVASGHHDAAPAPRAVCQENGPVPYARTWFGGYGGGGGAPVGFWAGAAGAQGAAPEARGGGTAPVVFGAEPAGSQGAVPEARAAGNGGRTCRKKYCYASCGSGELLRDRSEVRPAQKKGPGSRRGRCGDASVGSLPRRFGSSLRSTGTGSDGLRFRFAAVEPAHGVGPNGPRGDLRGGVFPGALRGDRKYGELRAIALRLARLGIGSGESYDGYGIEVHVFLLVRRLKPVRCSE